MKDEEPIADFKGGSLTRGVGCLRESVDYIECSSTIKENEGEGNKIDSAIERFSGLDLGEINWILGASAGGAENIQRTYPLSSLQEGMLFEYLLNERDDKYVLSVCLEITCAENLPAFIEAMQRLVSRHDALRTAMAWENITRPVQIVYRSAILSVRELLLGDESNLKEVLNGLMDPAAAHIDLRKAPLLRLTIVKHQEKIFSILQPHHIIFDHHSWNVLFSEIVESMRGSEIRAPVTPKYGDYIKRALLDSEGRDDVTFFRKKLGDVEDPETPFGSAHSNSGCGDSSEARETLAPSLAHRIRIQARRLGVSPARLFHAAWALVIANASGQDDIVFGTVLSARPENLRGTIGLFVNTLPLRLNLGDVSASGLVEQTHRELTELLLHRHAALPLVRRCARNDARASLFEAVLNYRHSSGHWAVDQRERHPELRMMEERYRTNFSLMLVVDDLGDGFLLTTQAEKLNKANRVAHFVMAAVESLTVALETAQGEPCLSLLLMPARERREVLEVFNAMHAGRDYSKGIHELFESQVRRTPNAYAMTCQDRRMSYEDLDRRGNVLAKALIEGGVNEGELIGICVERGFEMVVGILGVLKAGCAYVPLDPAYPADRLEFMIEDARPSLVITTDESSSRVSGIAAVVVNIGSIETRGIQCDPYVGGRSGAKGLVYVIYTSGSTGRPKGTAMTHRSMVNLIEWHRESFGSEEKTRVLQFAALSFDVAFQEIFTTLCTGGELVMIDEWMRRDAAALIDFLNRMSIERLFVPPMMLQSLAECSGEGRALPSTLKDVICAGEQLRVSPRIVEFFERLDGCRLHNHYGPTESHVVTALTLSGNPKQWPALPSIGRPIANTQIYILNRYRQPVPKGVAGEIYIGGANVAQGYLDRPALTSERFVPDPFGERGRMYKTGDLGRWLEDGTVEYVGRNDDQVKIRGFRIELGEIESQLGRHAQVKEAAVVAREDVPGEKRLVAYLTQRDEIGVIAAELRAHLQGLLPEYMVPSAFVMLERLPLTPSGKLDRRALPVPEFGAYVSRRYEPPQGEVEEILAGIWQELLGVDRVGRDDNFFEIGGHSLLVLKLLFGIQKSLSETLTVNDVYRYSELKQLAARVRGGSIVEDYVDLAQEATFDEDLVGMPGELEVPAKAILLTGATGFVGRFLLRHLLEATDATIYCLVRAPSERHAVTRLKRTLVDWGLWHSEYESRVKALACDLRLQRWGLSEQAYQRLASVADSIYHCATSMNHLETYSMAKAANVDAVKEILRFASYQRPKLINYISTTAVFNAQSLTSGGRVVDEGTPIDSERHSQSAGYAASKWVAEKILMIASKRAVRCNIFRLGLVWGDTQRGRYDSLQRLYRTIKSSLLTGQGIKEFRIKDAPAPVDYVVQAVVYLAGQHPEGNSVFHIPPPEGSFEGLFERCNAVARTSLRLVSSYEWIQQIRRLQEAGSVLPVAPLIEFAFSMTESEFRDYEVRQSSSSVDIKSERTRLELSCGGIVAPPLSDTLLKRCLHDMLDRDKELEHRMYRSEESSAGSEESCGLGAERRASHASQV